MISIVLSTKGLKRTDVEGIVSCYSSVLSSGVSFELLVQDNGSDAGFLNELRDLPNVSLESSEDTGIYDAWNKALRRASGDKVCFLGVDDFPNSAWLVFADAHTLTGNEAVVCDVDYVSIDGQVLGTYFNPYGPLLDMRVCRYVHPGLIFSSSIFEVREFNTSFRIISDGLFYAKLPFLAIKAHWGRPGVSMTVGGTSNSPKGARARFWEYVRAMQVGEIEPTTAMLNRFVLSNLPQYLLSFFPALYVIAQKTRIRSRRKP